eukprot:3578945-Amphidinium_carterae.1
MDQTPTTSRLEHTFGSTCLQRNATTIRTPENLKQNTHTHTLAFTMLQIFLGSERNSNIKETFQDNLLKSGPCGLSNELCVDRVSWTPCVLRVLHIWTMAEYGWHQQQAPQARSSG